MNDEIERALELQMQVIKAQQELLAKHSELLSALQERFQGMAAANMVVLELMIAAAPQQKDALVQGLTQLQQRPELTPNAFMAGYLSELLEIASRPSRTTPEGRRSWLSLVPPSEVDPHQK